MSSLSRNSTSNEREREVLQCSLAQLDHEIEAFELEKKLLEEYNNVN